MTHACNAFQCFTSKSKSSLIEKWKSRQNNSKSFQCYFRFFIYFRFTQISFPLSIHSEYMTHYIWAIMSHTRFQHLIQSRSIKVIHDHSRSFEVIWFNDDVIYPLWRHNSNILKFRKDFGCVGGDKTSKSYFLVIMSHTNYDSW